MIKMKCIICKHNEVLVTDLDGNESDCTFVCNTCCKSINNCDHCKRFTSKHKKIEINEKFEKELTHIINRHSIDNMLNTPDFKIAKKIINFLKNWRNEK
jgi:hypothetical protein